MCACLLLGLLDVQGEVGTKCVMGLHQDLPAGFTDAAVRTGSTGLADEHMPRHTGLVLDATDDTGGEVLRFGCVLAELRVGHLEGTFQNGHSAAT